MKNLVTVMRIIAMISFMIAMGSCAEVTTGKQPTPLGTDIYAPEVTEHNAPTGYDEYLWVGDSRTVGMSGVASMNTIAESGMGLNYLKEKAPEVLSVEGNNVVFFFGVNDLDNVYKYAQFYNDISDEFFEHNDVFVLTVTPVDEEKERDYDYNISNISIDQFNEELTKKLKNKIHVIDTGTYLKEVGFDTLDGIHYTDDTYRVLYNYIVQEINKAA